MHQDSPAWVFFVYTAFAVAVSLMGIGIYALPVDLWTKGYFCMGLFFTIGSTITLSKTVRDLHENRKFVNRLKEAKTERLLTEYEIKAS